MTDIPIPVRLHDRQADALERIATALEAIAAHLAPPVTAAPAAPQPDADGWIAWHGGECPVPPDTRVGYRMRKDKIRIPSEDIVPARYLRWRHVEGLEDNDIIAYRITK